MQTTQYLITRGPMPPALAEILPDTEVTMPENTAYFRLACDLGVNSTQFKAYKLTLSREE